MKSENAKRMSFEEMAEILNAPGNLEYSGRIDGCIEFDIACLENTCKVKLPEMYKEFLRCFGRHRGYFLGDYTASYPSLVTKHIETIRAWKPTWKREWAKTAFVFADGDGQVFYFDTASGESDPPVYCIDEFGGKAEKVLEHFSEWVYLEVGAHVELRQDDDDCPEEPSPHFARLYKMLECAPFKPGERAVLSVDLLGIDSGLGDDSKIDLSGGTEVLVYDCWWDSQYGYTFPCEVVDEDARLLKAILDLREEQLCKLETTGEFGASEV